MVKRALAILFILAMLPVLVFSGTTGKIAGTITDAETGEPLVGANVVIEGTMMGASTNMDGYYVILNVPVAAHTVRVSYMGYRTHIEENLRVSVDLTTEFNVQLETAALEGETVVVTAERKLIRKDETNTNILRTAKDIEVLPMRGVQQIVAAVAGVVRQDNDDGLNVRGGRTNETAVYIDGVLANDPYNFANRAYIPNEAIEEVSVQTGGFNAEYGEAMSGIVIMTTNAGRSKYFGSLQAITDEFLSKTDKTLNTYSYGYNEYTATLGGPIIPGKQHTFFGSVSREYKADGAPSWGWAYNDDKSDEFAGGVVPGQADQRWSYTGKIKLQISKSMELKSSLVWTDRIYSFTGGVLGMNPIWLHNVDHAPQSEQHHRSVNVTFTHIPKPTTYYDLRFGYFESAYERYDRKFGDDLLRYGDPTEVTADGGAWAADDQNWGLPYTAAIEPDFSGTDEPYNAYLKNNTSYIGFSFDLTHQQGKYNTIKAGFDYKYHTMRYFFLNPVYLGTGERPGSELSELEVYRQADVRSFGYDIYGDECDSGDYLTDVEYGENGLPISGYTDQAPYNPIKMSAYLQDKIEFKDLVLNLGLRYDYINPNAWMFRDPEADYDDDGNYIAGTGMFGGDERFDSDDVIDSETYDYLSPRLGVSFPVTDNTVFHAQYGKFYQAPLLQDLYLSPFYMDTWVNEGGYFTVMNNPNLRPLKTTSYEIGFRQRMGSYASLQLSAFYKETEDLATIDNLQTDARLIAMTINGDFGVIKGFDVIFTYRGVKNLSANFNYEFQIARGTGSATQTYRNVAWLSGSDANFPKFTMPLDFQQVHSATFNVDYRMGSKEGPELFGVYPFEKMGINMVAAFNSGRPYTMVAIQNSQPFTGRYETDISNQAISTINGQTTPSNFSIDFRLDRSFDLPVGNMTLNIYAWVINALNSEIITGVWPTTGLPDDTGYLQTSGGATYYDGLTAAQKQDWSMREMNYVFYGQPRQIRLGARLNF